MLGSPGYASQCLPTGQFTDLSTGSAVRSDHDYFQCPGSLVTSQDNLQDNLQCHNATVPLTTSHLLRLYPQLSHSSTPDPRDIRRPQHRLCHLSIQAGGASQDSRVRAKRMCYLKQASPMSVPPLPTTSPLPGLTVKICFWGSQEATLSGSRVQRLATNERSIPPSKPCGLMHGRVLAMSCRDSVQSLTHMGAPDPSRSSR